MEIKQTPPLLYGCWDTAGKARTGPSSTKSTPSLTKFEVKFISHSNWSGLFFGQLAIGYDFAFPTIYLITKPKYS